MFDKKENGKFLVEPRGFDVAFKFYDQLSQQYICKGSSSIGQTLVAQRSFDANKCWIEISEIEDMSGWLMDGLEDFQVFFSCT